MAFHPQPKCPVCQKIQAGDKKLERRINISRKWVKGGEALIEIGRSIGVSKNSITNHAEKHQAPTNRQLEQTNAKQALREIEGESAIQEVKVARHFSDDLQELKAIGMEMVRTGDSKVSAAVLAKLIDIEVKIEEKAKDRQFEYEKMLAHFASGAGMLKFDAQRQYISLPPSNDIQE